MSKSTVRLLIAILCPLSMCFASATAGAQAELSGQARMLYELSTKESRFFKDADALHPALIPTSDGKSFFLLWKSVPNPEFWIVSLHGAGFPARGFAADDLAIWYPNIKREKVGILCLQWWFGGGSRPENFYTPAEMFEQIESALKKLPIRAGSAMLHGFSRGSANLYALAALDGRHGTRLFSVIVASSGGISLDYPPNRPMLRGDYGKYPLAGTKWVTVAGGKDPNAERDGIPGMRRTAEWLKSQGAEVLASIEDPDSGHGALQRNPKNVGRVLELFRRANRGD